MSPSFMIHRSPVSLSCSTIHLGLKARLLHTFVYLAKAPTYNGVYHLFFWEDVKFYGCVLLKPLLSCSYVGGVSRGLLRYGLGWIAFGGWRNFTFNLLVRHFCPRLYVFFFAKAGSGRTWNNWGLRALLGGPMVISLCWPQDLSWWPSDHSHTILTYWATHHMGFLIWRSIGFWSLQLVNNRPSERPRGWKLMFMTHCWAVWSKICISIF